MTQIIGVIAQEFVFLAADRQLTIVEGPKKGQIDEREDCKLVSLCHTTGIGYTGPASLEGKPTHEWIAVTLASAAAGDPDTASRALVSNAARAVASLSPAMRANVVSDTWMRHSSFS